LIQLLDDYSGTAYDICDKNAASSVLVSQWNIDQYFSAIIKHSEKIKAQNKRAKQK
jgi:hypothetical protein